MKESQISEETRRMVCKDIADGATISEVVKKYGISVYYAKKWTGDIYKKIDMDMLIRRRYSIIACRCRAKLETDLASAMPIDEADAISERTWEKWDAILKDALYDYACEIITAN